MPFPPLKLRTVGKSVNKQSYKRVKNSIVITHMQPKGNIALNKASHINIKENVRIPQANTQIHIALATLTYKMTSLNII